MLNKIKNIFYILYFSLFVFFVITFYFSEENVIKVNKSRTVILEELNKSLENLPLLKSDTKDIVEFKNDLEIEKKNKKYNLFWKLIEN